MILRDFEEGRFPLTRRSPAICTLADGTVKVAYNRYDLAQIILKEEVLSCVGMWPGKKNTDIFILDPSAYTIAPPEKHKEIDSASEIILYYDPNGDFIKLSYKLSDDVDIISDEHKLLEYVKTVGLKFQTRFEK